ncbi:MAG: response regulator [Rhodospirillales bacterium]|nr:response regulator [Rhodospirillales bacterium]
MLAEHEHSYKNIPDASPVETGESCKDPQEHAGEIYDILLVEDDTDDRLLALHTLKQSPYIGHIHFFRSGEDLIHHFTRQGYYHGNLIRLMPTLILLDIHIPGRDGWDILRDLKRSPVTGDIPVIILTGDLTEGLREQARQYHANAFLNKPLVLEEVHDVILTGWGWPDGVPPEQDK